MQNFMDCEDDWLIFLLPHFQQLHGEKKDIRHWIRVSGQTLIIIIICYSSNTWIILWAMNLTLLIHQMRSSVKSKEWKFFVIFDIDQSSFGWLIHRILHLYCSIFSLFLSIHSPNWQIRQTIFKQQKFSVLKTCHCFHMLILHD